MGVINSSQPGFWASDLDEAAAISASKEYVQIRCSEDGRPYWVELRPDDSGRSLLCCEQNGVIKVVTPASYSVRSKVHEYGGDSWCPLGNDQYLFVNAEDQQLYIHFLSGDGAPRQLTHCLSSRFLQPQWDRLRNRIIVVEELHSAEQVVNRLVSIDLDTSATSILHQGEDFYAYPVLDFSAKELAFVCWSHPDQPWTSTRLYHALCNEEGGLSSIAILAGDKQQEALSQPLFTQSGELWVVSDRQDWWNIYRCVDRGRYEDTINEDAIDGKAGENSKNARGALLNLVNEQADMIPSPWQGGAYHYFEYKNEPLYLRYQHESISLTYKGQQVVVEGVNHYKSLYLQGDKLFAVVAGEEHLAGIAEIDLLAIFLPEKQSSIIPRMLTGWERPLNSNNCSLPIAKRFEVEGGDCYGYLYKGTNAQYSNASEVNNPADSLTTSEAPLVIFLHGGPTAATYPVLNLKTQYWTQRGFAVLDLNYRGSSNYGRKYRNLLRGKWGVSETEDIRCSVQALIESKEIDPKGVFIRGNSSGGYTALNAMCELNCFAAGASLYGVTDPATLNEVTHKFESYYLHWLIGDPVSEAERYKQYAPVNKAVQINCPVVFFQGERDAVVVPEQTREMIKALEEKGVPVEAHFFPDEAHGFRKAENQQWVLKQELIFYQKALMKNLRS